LLSIIQSLWVGSRLSAMQQLSIRSYLHHGHPYHLYTYGDLQGVPAGVVLKDAQEILCPDLIPQFRFLAQFADFFRYNLILQKGGWWCDTDTICLRPFDFKDDYVFAQEDNNRGVLLNNGYIKAPAQAPILQWIVENAARANWKIMPWGHIGPSLLTEGVKKFGLAWQPPAIFNPLPWWDSPKPLICSNGFAPPPAAYSVHLWNEMWNRNHTDKEAQYPMDSFYEQLKRQYA
jgi:Glycosyltransferase sugar-binding region containing DXD motif